MKHTHFAKCLLAGLLGLALNAQSAGLADSLGSKLGGSLGASPALSAAGLMGSADAGNAAGVITYCMKNNYLNADKTAQLKGQLLGKMGLGVQEEPKDEGYLSGLSGLITGGEGKTLNLDKIKGDLKEKACDYVLDNAQSLL